MGLIERPCPDEAKKLFLSILPPAAVSPPGPDAGGAGDSSQPPGPLITLPVFVLGLPDLARGRVAGGAKQAGWQFLTIDSKGVITSGEAPAAGSGAEPSAITRSQGPSWIKAYSAYDEAKKLKELLQNDYEPRTLRIPRLRIEVFWMRRKSDNASAEQLNEDFIVPFHTFNPELLANVVFSMRDFLAIVQPLAAQQVNSASPKD